jgi:hypothetical protein
MSTTGRPAQRQEAVARGFRAGKHKVDAFFL